MTKEYKPWNRDPRYDGIGMEMRYTEALKRAVCDDADAARYESLRETDTVTTMSWNGTHSVPMAGIARYLRKGRRDG